MFAALSVWVLVVTSSVPGRAPLQYEPGRFATEGACETFKAQIIAAAQKARLTAETVSTAQGLIVFPSTRTYVCKERREP